MANVTTSGFRADLAAQRVMPVYSDGYPTRVFAMSERPGIDFKAGSIVTTGNDLHVAVNGEGWIAVQAPDLSEAYTRAGDLRINSNGQLETGAGHPVLGNGGPIAIPPSESLFIAVDGTISIQPLGQEPNALATLDRIKLVQPPVSELVKGADGLLRRRDGAEAEATANVRLVQGALESSNVNGVSEMIDMITNARRFESLIKAMQTADENEAALAQIVRLT